MSRLFSTRSGKLIVIVILLASLGLIIVQVQHVQNLLQNAQTPLTPPVTSPEGKKNPISWSSPQVSLMADDFYIMADGKKFLGNAADIKVHSDPGSMAYTTLEVTWFEGGVEMRINIYFDHREGDFWKVSEIRTYNGQTPGDWIYYKTIDGDSFLGNELGSPLILPRLDLGSDISNPYNVYSGTVYFENLKLWPFLTYMTPSSALPTVTLTPTPTMTPSPTITPTPKPKPSNKNFYPTDDATIRSDKPTNNYGTSTTVSVDGNPKFIALLKFNLSSLAGKRLKSAQLRLWVNNRSSGSFGIFPTSSVSWTEAAVAYVNRPSLGGRIASFAAPANGSWVSVDLTSFVKTKLGAKMGIAITTTSSDAMSFNSQENAVNKPRLTVSYQ